MPSRLSGGANGKIDVALPITQEELASWSASSRESTARSLRTVRTLGLIETHRRRFIVRDLDRLRARSSVTITCELASRVARFRQDTKVAALKRSPLFEGLTRKQLVMLARLTDDLDVSAGSVLCKEGQRGREFFVIIDGEAEVTRGGKCLATIGGGEFFGEIALLERVARTATVTATTQLRFFVVSDSAFSTVVPLIRASSARFCARLLGGWCP